MKKLLIANRSEIARRVIRTAHRMGIATVAVYSDPDRDALHVHEAGTAVALGGSASADSYLRIDKLLAAAQSSGADAVHPGYGFLSESAEFAQAVIDAGLIWVGPPPAAIRALGSKSAAKALALAHGVPCLPGYHGAAQDEDTLQAEAQRIGLPLMVKAVAGGGGRGMRLVTEWAQLLPALRSARSEALAGFGSGDLLLERALLQPAPCGGAGVCRRAWPLHPPRRARLLGAAAAPEDHRRVTEPGGLARAARRAGPLRRGAGAGRGLCGGRHGGVLLDQESGLPPAARRNSPPGAATRKRRSVGLTFSSWR